MATRRDSDVDDPIVTRPRAEYPDSASLQSFNLITRTQHTGSSRDSAAR